MRCRLASSGASVTTAGNVIVLSADAEAAAAAAATAAAAVCTGSVCVPVAGSMLTLPGSDVNHHIILLRHLFIHSYLLLQVLYTTTVRQSDAQSHYDKTDLQDVNHLKRRRDS